ncbi:Hypothetical protein, predicted lipoprotein, DUF285 family [Mycoplasmopsis agalactiae 14628]|uniref:Lipoprotein n=1 Tax=Mycoplasmopsis agalactiae 14628 TaxID=1110504 RepID=I5D591_MYCAA|nr:BspA family leucine-rich repeat surface protein [Mycoplasmopsis agalactiae]EIN14850.1 Hypothetical protein, predicted lipoprotein, DUF285 family [Mycoplasmopsis agalactiae 14628]
MKIKKLLLIAPLSTISMSFVAARCAKGESKQTEIINTGANRIETPADENAENNLGELSEQNGNKSPSNSEQNFNKSTTDTTKNSELENSKTPIKKELRDDETYKLNNLKDSLHNDAPLKEPTISPEDAKKYKKAIDDIWKKHKYGFADFHTFDDVLKQLRVYAGNNIAKFLELNDKNNTNNSINKNNPKKVIDLKIGSKKFSLKFGDIKHTVPTVYSYKGEENNQFYVYGTESKDFNIKNSKKIIIKQLGYYKDSNGEYFKIVTVPKNTVEVPAILPLKINSLAEAFKGLEEETVTNLDKWDTTNIVSLLSTFDNAKNFNQSLKDWNTLNVKNMTSVFTEAKKFNSSLENWKTDNVITMEDMFAGAESFNQDISKWNTKNVTDMSKMFWGATAFNSSIGNWDVSNVKSMERMFASAETFNQDIGRWDVQKVESMYGMFGGAKSFDQDISLWKLYEKVYYQDFTNNESVLNHDHLPQKFKTAYKR